MAQQHLVIPDCAAVVHNLKLSTTRNASIVSHVVIPPGQVVDVTLTNAFSAAMATLWSTNLASHCPSSVSFLGSTMRDLRQQGMPIISPSAGNAVGTGTGDPLPLQIAAVLTLRTARAGKSYRGRAYWAGFGESENDATGRIATALKTALDAFAAGYIGAHAQSGCSLGVAHRPTQFDPNTGLPIAPGLGFVTPCTQVLVRDTRWDSQRRRAGRT